MIERFDKSKILPLSGWYTVADVADILYRKRTRIHQMIEESKFKPEELRYIGAKKFLLISEEGVKRIQEELQELTDISDI
jgi:DNA-directed RNA polymerase subunit F